MISKTLDKNYIFYCDDNQIVDDKELKKALSFIKKYNYDIVYNSFKNLKLDLSIENNNIFQYSKYPNFIIKKSSIYHLPIFVENSNAIAFLYMKYNLKIGLSGINTTTIKKKHNNLYIPEKHKISDESLVIVQKEKGNELDKFLFNLNFVNQTIYNDLIIIDNNSLDGYDYKSIAKLYNAKFSIVDGTDKDIINEAIRLANNDIKNIKIYNLNK